MTTGMTWMSCPSHDKFLAQCAQKLPHDFLMMDVCLPPTEPSRSVLVSKVCCLGGLWVHKFPMAGLRHRY